MPNHITLRVIALMLACLTLWPRDANAQCGASISGHFGGEVSAVAQINASGLLVARGTWLELMSLANPNAPASFSPVRRVALSAPARKIAYTPGSSRAFVMLDNGNVLAVTILSFPLLDLSPPVSLGTSGAVDILADGQFVYIANTYEIHESGYSNSDIRVFDLTTGIPRFVRYIDLLISAYSADRLAKIGNTLWIGFHEFESSIYGVDGINVADPANPVRVVTSLNNIPLAGTFSGVTAMTAIGNRLMLTYRYNGLEDRIRAVDVTGNPVWFPAYDQNAYSSCMASVGDLLRVNFQNSGIGTWNTANPSAMSFLGAYFDGYPNVYQIVAGASGGVTDYWAAGRAGLWTMNTANPAALSVRSVVNNFPAVPSKVRQMGNTTAVIDHASNTLRLFDYTLPESQQLRGTLALPLYSEFLELAILNGGARTLACVATHYAPSNSIAIIEITNPATPILLSTITGFTTEQLSCSTSRLYAVTNVGLLKTYELSVPTNPALRSSLTLNVPYGAFTCMTSWSNNALAIGTDIGGVLLMDTTNATAPVLASTYLPVADYHVRAMAKGTNYLYVSAAVGPPENVSDTRLESLNVSTMSAPVRRWLSSQTTGAGWPSLYDNLAYVSAPAGKFLVGTQPHNTNDPTDNDLAILELPIGFFVNENAPFPIAKFSMSQAGTNGGSAYSGSGGNVVPSADGSRVLASAATAGIYQIAMPVQWAPGFGIQPFQQYLCYGSSVQYPVIASGNPTTVSYQWYRYVNAGSEVALVNGVLGHGTVVAGASESVLSISNFHPGDIRGYIYCKATNTCGTTQSATVYGSQCAGDFNCSSYTDAQDIFDFLNAWFAGSVGADVNGVNGVNVQDIFDFLAYWFTPCF